MDNKPFKIVYNSDLIIRDRSEAAALCVFYDKVFLPFTSEKTSGKLEGADGKTNYHQSGEIKSWDIEYRTLYDAGVLHRLPVFRDHYVESPTLSWIPIEIAVRPTEVPPEVKILNAWGKCVEWGEVLPGDHLLGRDYRKVLLKSPQGWTRECEVEFVTLHRRSHTNWEAPADKALDISAKDRSSILGKPVRTIAVGDSTYIARDLITHLIRNDIDMPQIFTSVKGQPIGREILVALEAEATFKYLLPKLHIFHPTQILELREKVEATREGFTMHLWKLSKGLEEHAKDGTSVLEIADFARNLIETDLLPDYREFRRQLAALNAGKWNKFLDAAGKIIEIDAAPWTPKFYGLLLRALGLSVITAASEQQDSLSNKYQAFKFMSDVEAASR
jgi:hypothetical protein